MHNPSLPPATGRPRPSLRPLLALALLLAAARPAATDPTVAPPEFIRLEPARRLDTDPRWQFDVGLQSRLERAVRGLGLGEHVAENRLGVALVDLSGSEPRVAAVNGDEMMYAASVPKIAVLYAAFQARREGRLRIDQTFHDTLSQMIRVSSNQAASSAIRRLGFDYIAGLLWQSRLYDPLQGGGLWVGKAYGGFNDGWHRDPVANTSHGATPLSLARLLTLLAEDRLVDPESSCEMKEILGTPGLHHKFVRGLEEARPGSTIYRKSGTWRDWHGDAALIERGDKRYVAVALCEDPEGGRILERLIVALDDCAGPERIGQVVGPASGGQG